MKRHHIIAVMALMLASLTLQAQGKNAAVASGKHDLQPDAEYLLLRQKYTIHSDGTTDINYRKELKLYRNRAITAYADKGETFILYNPATEKLTINESYTITADGRLVETPKNAFVDQLPSECTHCGRYNGMREMAVIHTALEYDATIVLDYTIHRSTNQIEEELVLPQDCPVRRYEIEVVSAGNVKVNYRYANFDAFGVKLTSAEGGSTGGVEYQSSFKSGATRIQSSNRLNVVAENLPQTYLEPYMPGPTQMYPVFAFSTIPTNGKPNGLVFRDRKVPQAENLLAELQNDDQSKYAVAIRNWVVDNMNLNAIPLDHCDYTATDPEVTFGSMCGTLVDRAYLLASLLQQAGLMAYPYFPKTDPATHTSGHLMFLYKQVAPEVCFAIGDNEFALSLTNKSMPTLKSGTKASDRVAALRLEREIPFEVTHLAGDAFLRATLPSEPKAFKMNAALITSVREAPLQIPAVDESMVYHMRCPYGVSLASPVNIHQTIPGVGSMSVTIRQVLNEVTVTRTLELTEQVLDLIRHPETYQQFRTMLANYQSTTSFLLKNK